MYCSKCGNQLPEGVRFCPSCGAPVNTPAQENNVPEPVVNTAGGAAPQNTAPAKSKKKKLPLMILAVVIVIAAAFGIIKYMNSGTRVLLNDLKGTTWECSYDVETYYPITYNGWYSGDYDAEMEHVTIDFEFISKKEVTVSIVMDMSDGNTLESTNTYSFYADAGSSGSWGHIHLEDADIYPCFVWKYDNGVLTLTTNGRAELAELAEKGNREKSFTKIAG